MNDALISEGFREITDAIFEIRNRVESIELRLITIESSLYHLEHVGTWAPLPTEAQLDKAESNILKIAAERQLNNKDNDNAD